VRVPRLSRLREPKGTVFPGFHTPYNYYKRI
jgi:hypothetical protein